MDSIQKKISNLGLFGTEWEKKVVEVTKDDRDVVDSAVLREIADATQDYNLYNEIMTKLFERIDQPPKQWKIVYKCLGLVEALIRSGRSQCIDDFKSNMGTFRRLEHFQYINTKGEDCGANVRAKSKSLIELLENDEQIREMREESQRTRNRYEGVGSSHFDAGYGGNYGGGYGGGYGGNYGGNYNSDSYGNNYSSGSYGSGSGSGPSGSSLNSSKYNSGSGNYYDDPYSSKSSSGFNNNNSGNYKSGSSNYDSNSDPYGFSSNNQSQPSSNTSYGQTNNNTQSNQPANNGQEAFSMSWNDYKAASNTTPAASQPKSASPQPVQQSSNAGSFFNQPSQQPVQQQQQQQQNGFFFSQQTAPPVSPKKVEDPFAKFGQQNQQQQQAAPVQQAPAYTAPAQTTPAQTTYAASGSFFSSAPAQQQAQPVAQSVSQTIAQPAARPQKTRAQKGGDTDAAFSLFLESEASPQSNSSNKDGGKDGENAEEMFDSSLVDISTLSEKKKEPEKKKGVRIQVSTSGGSGVAMPMNTMPMGGMPMGGMPMGGMPMQQPMYGQMPNAQPQYGMQPGMGQQPGYGGGYTW